MKKVAIIQARLGSSRLPEKTLMKIKGKPIIEHIFDFLSLSKELDSIVVATTNLEDDDEIERFCQKKKYSCFSR